jgi:hypothetical protein
LLLPRLQGVDEDELGNAADVEVAVMANGPEDAGWVLLKLCDWFRLIASQRFCAG